MTEASDSPLQGRAALLSGWCRDLSRCSRLMQCRSLRTRGFPIRWPFHRSSVQIVKERFPAACPAHQHDCRDVSAKECVQWDSNPRPFGMSTVRLLPSELWTLFLKGLRPSQEADTRKMILEKCIHFNPRGLTDKHVKHLNLNLKLLNPITNQLFM